MFKGNKPQKNNKPTFDKPNKVLISLLVLIILLSAGFAIYLKYQNNQLITGGIRNAGGQCYYLQYPGTCTVLEIRKTEKSINQGGNSFPGAPEGYEVWFTFKTDENIEEEWARPKADDRYL